LTGGEAARHDIWLHGGGGLRGRGRRGWRVYDGACACQKTATSSVVSRSINRLNVFRLPLSRRIGGARILPNPVTPGMLDVMLALWWVRGTTVAKIWRAIPPILPCSANMAADGVPEGLNASRDAIGARDCLAQGDHPERAWRSLPLQRCGSRDREETFSTRPLLEASPRTWSGYVLFRRARSWMLQLRFNDENKRRGARSGSRRSWTRLPWPVTRSSRSRRQQRRKCRSLFGHTKDEGTFFIATDAKFGVFTEEDLKHSAPARWRLERSDALIAALRKTKSLARRPRN